MDKKRAEATTLKRKKTTINKAKIKKTIKNTLCRPDRVFWPNVSEDHGKLLEAALTRHRVEIPEFNKPHWKILKSIPKKQRPKQPKIQRVEGLIFGLMECTEAIKVKQCSAVIIESTVNPRTIVQPLIEACICNEVPIVCLACLKKITSVNFGIPTSCLAIKSGFLHELSKQIEEIAKLHQVPKPLIDKDTAEVKLNIESDLPRMDVDENITNVPTTFKYLYRTSKDMRVFNPSQHESKVKKEFVGQDFIVFSDKTKQQHTDSDNRDYKSMILKRITNNQNRPKRK